MEARTHQAVTAVSAEVVDPAQAAHLVEVHTVEVVHMVAEAHTSVDADKLKIEHTDFRIRHLLHFVH